MFSQCSNPRPVCFHGNEIPDYNNQTGANCCVLCKITEIFKLSQL